MYNILSPEKFGWRFQTCQTKPGYKIAHPWPPIIFYNEALEDLKSFRILKIVISQKETLILKF